MEFNLRYVATCDYTDILCKWWEDWGWTPPPLDMLPDTGFILSNQFEEDICAGFLYKTDSKVCWLEYIVSDKKYKRDDRSRAITSIIDYLSKKAKEEDFKYIYTSLKNKPLIKKYESCGFIKGDESCLEMVKIL